MKHGVALALVVTALFAAGEAAACSPDRTPVVWLEPQATAIIIAEVFDLSAVRQHSDGIAGTKYTYRLRAVETIKGSAPADFTRDSFHAEDCQFWPPAEGELRVIWLQGDDNKPLYELPLSRVRMEEPHFPQYSNTAPVN